MIAATTFSGKKVALVGLGGSGIATALALQAGGASIEAYDDNKDRMDAAAEQGINIKDLKQADWNMYHALILAPGIPLTHPVPHWSVHMAQRAGIEIIGDLELFYREKKACASASKIIAITGTNGKSTTTALISHILREAGLDVQMGGNIGTAVLSLEPFHDNRVYVVECSSFQIDLAPSLHPDIGVLLNLSPDHIDRHGSMENYASLKERLVRNSDLSILGDDDLYMQAINARIDGKKIIFSAQHDLADGFFMHGQDITGKCDKTECKVAELQGISTLRGRHNAQNACAAAAVAYAMNISLPVFNAALQSFPGLPHRMEQVGAKKRTLFINDSKATNADSAEKALQALDNIFWILGGKPKEGGITSLIPLFPKITKAYLIGEASDAFAETLNGKVPFEKCGTLDIAVARAAEDALTHDGEENTVLLSPACASYDQYPNFEVRGDHFRSLVSKLI